MKKILFIAVFSVFAFIACSSENKSDTNTSSEANLSEANSSANKVTGTNVSIIPIEWTSLGDRIELKHSMGVAEVQKNPQYNPLEKPSDFRLKILTTPNNKAPNYQSS